MAKATILGSAITPRDWPSSDSGDWADYYEKAAEIGGHVNIVTGWGEEMSTSTIATMQADAAARGLGFHLNISPISIVAPRDQPDIPAGLTQSFANATTRQAFKDFIMARAALGVTRLGLATEANLFKANGSEWPHFVTLMEETYALVKASYPALPCFISFQWDIMRAFSSYSSLADLAAAVDVFAFTSFPWEIGYMTGGQVLPATYYAEIRTQLPTERLSISELGFTSPPMGSQRLSRSFSNSARPSAPEPHAEIVQAAFYQRVPAMVASLGLEWLTLALLHDISMFNSPLDYCGVRYNDGTAKRSWAVVNNLAFA